MVHGVLVSCLNMECLVSCKRGLLLSSGIFPRGSHLHSGSPEAGGRSFQAEQMLQFAFNNVQHRHQVSQVILVVKNLPAVQKWMWVQSLARKDPLEEEMATHSSILAWRIPWTEEPGKLQSIWSQRVGHDWSDLAHVCTITCNTFLWFFPWTLVVALCVYAY